MPSAKAWTFDVHLEGGTAVVTCAVPQPAPGRWMRLLSATAGNGLPRGRHRCNDVAERAAHGIKVVVLRLAKADKHEPLFGRDDDVLAEVADRREQAGRPAAGKQGRR